MKPHEIERFRDEPHGEEWLSLQKSHNRWLREIAYQLATFNDILADVRFDIHIYNHDGGASDAKLLETLFGQFKEEITQMAKTLSAEARAAITAALATLGDNIGAAVNAAVTKETADIVLALQKLQSQNGPITAEDVGGIVTMIQEASPAIVTALTGKIDEISKGSGADDASGGTGGTGGGPTP